MDRRILSAKLLILLCLALVPLPVITSPMALCAGILIAMTLGNPWVALSKKYSSKVMTLSLIALGAGMNLFEVAKVGLHGFGYTMISISVTLLLGYIIMRLLKSDYESSLLIAVGTAICGGSAIAAVAPTINAKSSTISVALAVVFILNSMALLLFPPLGHYLGLSQHQFGLWAALAIHDTSSVVGSTMQYGAEALQVGTTIKLARALWIVPVAFAIGYLHQKYTIDAKERIASPSRPWFILGFLLMAAFFTWSTQGLPQLEPLRSGLEFMGRRGMVLTLFLIGLNLNRNSFKTIGMKPVGLGIILWMLVSSLSVASILLHILS